MSMFEIGGRVNIGPVTEFRVKGYAAAAGKHILQAI
jgi:hypothetical protein